MKINEKGHPERSHLCISSYDFHKLRNMFLSDSVCFLYVEHAGIPVNAVPFLSTVHDFVILLLHTLTQQRHL